MDRQNLSGQKYLVPAWDRAKTISIHTQKQNPPCSTFDSCYESRRVGSPRPTNHARLHLRCARIDPRMTPKPPFTGYVYIAVQESASYIEHPPSVITYHTHLCCFVFATTFHFLNFAFHFSGKKLCPPFCRLATPLSLYTFLLWIISKNTYLPEGYRMMVYFWILLKVF